MSSAPRGVGLPLGLLAALNGGVWLCAWAAFADRPALLGSALLAWVFGLRHAADADHLAAIDNVVRRLMQDGQRPSLVGLWFSLGHSSVVVLACVVLGLTASDSGIDPLREAGAVLGTVISALFLVLIAAVNSRLLLRLLRGDTAAAEARGVLARVLRPATRLVRRPAHMVPVGFLFGLGFDTATEIGLLALSATQAARGLSLAEVLIFPALFTAGMALVDTADSALMVGAYGWALNDAARKRHYNLLVTGVSVALALGVGGIEAASLLAEQAGLRGWAWRAAGALNDALPQIGFAMIALFLAAWGVSALLYRRRFGIAYQPRRLPQRPSSGG